MTVWIPAGTGGDQTGEGDGTTIMQIYRRLQPEGAEIVDLMLNVDNEVPGGRLRRYRPLDKTTIFTGIYEYWWNLKVVHDADIGQIYVYVNDVCKHRAPDQGPAIRRFKNGVYHHDEASPMSKVYFGGLRYWY